MLKRFLWGLFCAAFPWIVLLIHDNPGGALAALVMQASLLGWPPATIWAWRTVKESGRLTPKKKPPKEKAS